MEVSSIELLLVLIYSGLSLKSSSIKLRKCHSTWTFSFCFSFLLKSLKLLFSFFLYFWLLCYLRSTDVKLSATLSNLIELRNDVVGIYFMPTSMWRTHSFVLSTWCMAKNEEILLQTFVVQRRFYLNSRLHFQTFLLYYVIQAHYINIATKWHKSIVSTRVTNECQI